MRTFIAVLVLIFSLQSWTKADDISDFELDGISIGDSILNFISEDVISTEHVQFYPKNNKFKQINIETNTLKLETYDAVAIAVKSNDKNYIIHEIKGWKKFSNHKECLNAKEQVTKDLKDLFKDANYKINTYTNETSEDPNSTYKSVDFILQNGLARVYCIDWSDEFKNKGPFYNDSVTVTIYNSEFQEFLATAY